MTKTLSLFNNVVDGGSPYFGPQADKYMDLFLLNANTGYAEVSPRSLACCDQVSKTPFQVRSHVAQILATILDEQWRPVYSTCDELLVACREKKDPFGLRCVLSVYLLKTSLIMPLGRHGI